MTWVLFESADASMMLVKKRNKGPRRKPAARNLKGIEESTQSPLLLPPSPPTCKSQQQVEVGQEQKQPTLPPPFDPPPPYTPRQDYAYNNGLSKPSVTPATPLTKPIPPPLPPRPRYQDSTQSSTSRQLEKSCPELARLVAKSVKNVQDSMNQDPERREQQRLPAKSISNVDEHSMQDKQKVVAKSEHKTKDSLDQDYNSGYVTKTAQNVEAGLARESRKKANAKQDQSFADRVKQGHGKRTLARAAQNITDTSEHPYDKNACQISPSSPQSALEDLISTKLDDVLTSIDGEAFSGNEKDLDIYDRSQPSLRGGWGSARAVSQGANRAISSTLIGINYFKKANLYANSKLPPNLPPLKLFMPSFPLLCLAAQYSQRVYTKPAGKEREAHVDANWKMGTKAMVIKSVPVDDMNTIVFAIRGTQTFMDWAVNINSAPVSPGDFLDDPGNLCHSGFLSVARKMIRPVASRLRSLLQEDPTRSSCSLLMTGHSAGGAVASLLYAHMLATDIKSELNILTGCFKRIHCLTFGAPPVSLLPLTKPHVPRLRKSLFLSFVNEGDPVPRADRAYVRSLLELFASPAPSLGRGSAAPASPSSSSASTSSEKEKPQKCTLAAFVRPKTSRTNSAPAAMITSPSSPPQQQRQYIWPVPPGTLSNAGRLVVLRGEKVSRDNMEDDVRAEIASNEQLRECVFGDPVMHMMKVYARRVEVLATKAVTAKVWG